MTTVSLKMPEALLRQIEEEAAARGVPKSAVIRASLERTLRRGRRAKAKVSCLDLVRDLAGHFEGPADLSTNKKYLKEALLSDDDRKRPKNRG
jgi:Arc/MetJ-type ribon-helix-helix transcriptional regulator